MLGPKRARRVSRCGPIHGYSESINQRGSARSGSQAAHDRTAPPRAMTHGVVHDGGFPRRVHAAYAR